MIDDNSKEFIKRHIGPSEEEQSKMLQYVGYKSLEDLMEKLLLEKIRKSFHQTILKLESSLAVLLALVLTLQLQWDMLNVNFLR